MSTRSLVLTLLALTAFTSEAQRNVPLPSVEEAARVGLNRKWFSYVPLGRGEEVDTVSVAEHEIHVKTSSSRLHSIDAESGKLMWSTQIGRATANPYRVAMNSNSIFAISGTTLYRISRNKGAIIWKKRLPSVPSSRPAADEEHVMVVTLDGRVHVFDIQTLEETWYYQTDGPSSVPPMLVGNQMACASEDGFLYVFAKSDRRPVMEPIFQFQTSSPIRSPLAVWKNVIFMAEDYSLWAIDSHAKLNLRQSVWASPYSTGGIMVRPVTVVGDEVYLIPTGEGMHSVDAKTGTRRWRTPNATHFVAATDKHVYAADSFGRMLVLSRETGAILKSWDTHRFQELVRNAATDRIFLMHQSGLMVGLHELGLERPIVHGKKASSDDATADGT